MKLAVLLVAFSLPYAVSADEGVNPIHPTFVPLDAVGRRAASGDKVSAATTCGRCHDAGYIDKHSDHGNGRTTATCIQCHVRDRHLDVSRASLDARGQLRRQFIRIGSPRPENCASCHGLIAPNGTAVALPPDFEAASGSQERSLSLTQGEGAIVSPERINESFLNIAGKAELASPWDVHAAKLVECTACHYARNNPARTDSKQTRLSYLVSDPRRESMAEFLHRPNHLLAAAACTSCHDASAAHDFLPYRARHLQVVACETCHVPAVVAPVAEMVDSTVATRAGTPFVQYRNVERRDGETLNAATVRPFEPLLVERSESDGARRLSPLNIVSRWRWLAGAGGAEVPFAIVSRAYLDKGSYRADILAAFDHNHDGQLDASELRLDTPAAVKLVAERLRGLGVADPVIDGTFQTFPIAHGVAARERALRDCDACHGANSRLGGDLPLSPYLPGGVSPRPAVGGIELAGRIVPMPKGGLRLEGDERVRGVHVLGFTHEGIGNQVGFALFALVFLGVLAHALVRVSRRGRRAPLAKPVRVERSYAFGVYERLWHWTMALSGVGLILTGLVVHYPAWRYWPISLPAAVSVHNVLAVVLMANAFLALFYHLTTAAVRNFLPERQGLLGRILEHLEYQTRGIFYGAPEPGHEPGHKLNPLQQLTYLALLNVLFPLQIGTGVLIWAVGRSARIAAAVGGLGVVAPLHNFGAWLFLAFFVLHVYLVTTGRTVGEHLRSMITGYRSVEPQVEGGEPAPEGPPHPVSDVRGG